MRALVLTLALINVLFFGWAHWIDRPVTGRAATATVTALHLAPALPKLANGKAELRCESFGPFTSKDTAAAVDTALRARSFNPRERVTRGEVADGYWVYIDNLHDAQARARALKRLARAGVRDAAALPTNGQVSVGLFSEQSGADLRAAAVRTAGLDPIIKPRLQTVDQYWYDVVSNSEVPLPPVAALMAGINVDTQPAWAPCPEAAPPAATP